MYDKPDARGHFGPYGGIFVSETLMFALEELKQAYAKYQHDPEFLEEFRYELKHFVGRPSPVSRQTHERTTWWRTDLSQARRS
jgi:tryptophan synthase beta chain